MEGDDEVIIGNTVNIIDVMYIKKVLLSDRVESTEMCTTQETENAGGDETDRSLEGQ